MSTYTPGPWFSSESTTRVFGDDGSAVAQKVNVVADRHLIAAAPDLLAVLVQLAAMAVECENCGGVGCQTDAPEDACRACGGVGERIPSAGGELGTIRAAIAKARGGK